ncbi:hypothetical protein EHI8A_057250 [Entamoeba histolytica HM-1:IMSS-B]|uniref:Nucleotidyl transferase domain-containing protein n=6 Tax=Entamoeba histolytica TaxID=5759 RepID=C4M2F4_ENTH1|nr:hypothetical protein EHI_158350 [Entamoeba histolytica HM-1:IMSS]EMD42618.1 Hypothetical protein EHI5A_084570 [Entamoeba histolytica KU27]EMH73384.1 hypothetical protein EHI8A_057250 [Entamoeba histolytica HM-1:IMSS-B]EMS12329.1 hypothetical protein KM1_101310 [Entamoeba histolytica HM-3:IMSS]ENY59860.1 hypothetical protein EHI7A_054330 [Entamoeba histolytica HM-1:IMSS-A]GAT95456.1 hypothetical protein CL6EHI_158350 [Entamoeba histolytica]|eukprot:XP_650155.1 hypothetical protein EHI_158350 [Entamoeba histolytica HM-1:IMSS]
MSDYLLANYSHEYENEFMYLMIETSMGTKFDNNDKLPKCLVMVGGKPIIQWQLEVLEKLNVKELEIVVGTSVVALVQSTIGTIKTTINIHYYPIDDIEFLHNGVALKKFREDNRENLMKYRDVIVIGTDLLFDTTTFTNFINQHRIESSYLTLLTTEEKRPKLKKGEEFDEQRPKDLLILNEQKRIFGMIYGNCSDKIGIPYDVLDRYPSLSIVDEIQTLRTFIVKSTVLARMPYSDKLTSIHKDVLPHIIKLLRGKFGQDIHEKTLNDLFNHIPSSFEPPCIYVLQKTGMTFRISQQAQIKKVEGMVKSQKLKLF